MYWLEAAVATYQWRHNRFARAVLSLDGLWTFLNSLLPETKIAEFANSVELEVAHYEAPYLDLYCLSSSI